MNRRVFLHSSHIIQQMTSFFFLFVEGGGGGGGGVRGEGSGALRKCRRRSFCKMYA